MGFEIAASIGCCFYESRPARKSPDGTSSTRMSQAHVNVGHERTRLAGAHHKVRNG